MRNSMPLATPKGKTSPAISITMNHRQSVNMNFRTVPRTQWQAMLKESARTVLQHCKDFPKARNRLTPTYLTFPTGSEYTGTSNSYGMETADQGPAAKGRYVFQNGVVYEGRMKDGEFDGEGELIYEDGTVLKGVWRKGEIIKRTLQFLDQCEYKEKKWTYCTMPDRRFQIAYTSDLQPAGRSYMTAQQPTPYLPEGCYDTVDGYYRPDLHVIVDYNNPERILRVPSEEEIEWIYANCRRNIKKPVGPLKELYEEWVKTGDDRWVIPVPCACMD